jgi:small-conductance mechanosensitive channel
VLALCWLTDPAAIATLRSRFASIGERWSQVERLESSESALTSAPAELQEMRSQVATLDAEMQARTASSQTELARVETIAADRARATEMAETAAALKAGELKQARAEIAALSARISQDVTVSSGRSARSFATSAALLRSLWPGVAKSRVPTSGVTNEGPGRRS